MSQVIGTELKIKAGETVSSGRLKITYVGVLSEEMRAQNLNLKNNEFFFFEITDGDKIYNRKASDTIVINELIIKIIKEKSDGSAATVRVINEEMAKRSLESDIARSIEDYENAAIAFERLAELMEEPAPDSIVGCISTSVEKKYFTFSNARPNSVSLNGVELKAVIGRYWIQANLLRKANLLMLYYRGECYKYSFSTVSSDAQKPHAFIMLKVIEKKILRDYKKKKDSN